jgi:hypothetical protein
MQNSKLRITELDFDKIKTNIVDFMKKQSEFSDYDFDGAGLSVLTDVLAYNTHYMSYYLNMVANEMFLDSVSQRSSAVSIAKHLGYVTQSTTGAEATATLTCVTAETSIDSPTTITIPQYTKFTIKLDDVSYIFYTLKSYTATTTDTGANRTYTATGVKLKQGKQGTIDFVVNQTGFEEKYIVPVDNLDTSTLIVKIKQTASSGTYDLWTLYENVTDLTSTSKSYFLQEVEDGKYEIYFGDGVLGAKLAQGNVITVEYLTSDGAVANGAGNDSVNLFKIATALSYIRPDAGTTGTVTPTISATSAATGGAVAETIDSIKYNAPKAFKTQDRAVTLEDYKSIVINKYTNASSVSVWGGEDNDPPDYGKVYIAIRPVTGLTLTDVSKADVKTILEKYKVLAITPVVVDPDYTFVIVDSSVYYNSTTSLIPAETMKENVTTTIKNYNNSTLNKFGTIFRHSQLTGLIDDTDTPIRSNVTKIKLKKRIKPTLGVLQGWIGKDTLKYGSAIVKGSVTSDEFTVCNNICYGGNVIFTDDSNGVINLTSGGTIIFEDIGTVDYTTGKITISGVAVNVIEGGTEYVYITADVDEADVKPVARQVITIQDADITVTMVEDVT